MSGGAGWERSGGSGGSVSQHVASPLFGVSLAAHLKVNLSVDHTPSPMAIPVWHAVGSW